MAPEHASRRLWTDGFYERLPLSPLSIGIGAALLLVGVLITLATALGAFAQLEALGMAWWQDRDGRMAALLAVVAATVPTALRYHELGTRRNLAALSDAGLWPTDPPPELRGAGAGVGRRALAFGASGLLLVPILAYSVDRNPGLYFSAAYWGLGQTWTWLVGSLTAFVGGVFTYRVYSDARAFARLARSLPEVDLLDREVLLPFARQGLRSSVPGVILLSFLALNLGDEGFQAAIVLLGVTTLIQNVMVLLLPIRGLRDRVRAAKREEVVRVNAAIRGEPDALRGSPLARGEVPALADLLAWRRFIESVPEWPIDASTLGRFALYVGIPLLSWVGAALVERGLDRVIG